MIPNDGGPAFPVTLFEGLSLGDGSANGMSLRAHFAGQAMKALIVVGHDMRQAVTDAIATADTMLAELAKPQAVTPTNDRATEALRQLLDVIEYPPERNCSCHLFPPCNDCVEYSGLREAIADAEAVLRGDK